MRHFAHVTINVRGSAFGSSTELQAGRSRVRLPIPVASRCKAGACGRLLVGIAGSNPAGGMDVCVVCYKKYKKKEQV